MLRHSKILSKSLKDYRKSFVTIEARIYADKEWDNFHKIYFYSLPIITRHSQGKVATITHPQASQTASSPTSRNTHNFDAKRQLTKNKIQITAW